MATTNLLQEVTLPEQLSMSLLQANEADAYRKALIAGGIILVGAGTGIAIYLLTRKPKSLIISANAYRQNSGVFITADVKNVGSGRGCFKLEGILVKADVGCPAGITGYNQIEAFTQILSCVNRLAGPTFFAGSWCGLPSGEGTAAGWVEVAPGATVTLSAESWQTQHGYNFPSGTYHLFAHAAVSPTCSSSDRLMKNEHYLWVPNISL